MKPGNSDHGESPEEPMTEDEHYGAYLLSCVFQQLLSSDIAPGFHAKASCIILISCLDMRSLSASPRQVATADATSSRRVAALFRESW